MPVNIGIFSVPGRIWIVSLGGGRPETLRAGETQLWSAASILQA